MYRKSTKTDQIEYVSEFSPELWIAFLSSLESTTSTILTSFWPLISFSERYGVFTCSSCVSGLWISGEKIFEDSNQNLHLLEESLSFSRFFATISKNCPRFCFQDCQTSLRSLKIFKSKLQKHMGIKSDFGNLVNCVSGWIWMVMWVGEGGSGSRTGEWVEWWKRDAKLGHPRLANEIKTAPRPTQETEAANYILSQSTIIPLNYFTPSLTPYPSITPPPPNTSLNPPPMSILHCRLHIQNRNRPVWQSFRIHTPRQAERELKKIQLVSNGCQKQNCTTKLHLKHWFF